MIEKIVGASIGHPPVYVLARAGATLGACFLMCIAHLPKPSLMCSVWLRMP